MNFALAAALAAPGLAVGSFLNVVAARLPTKIPIGRSRSRCVACLHEIATYDNVPLLSYALLRGRCRHCCAPIPMRYPVVEATSAILVAACVLHFGVTPDALVASLFCLVLVVLSAIDLEHRIVPNRVVLPAAAAVLAAHTAIDLSPEWALAALGASGFLFLAALAYPRGMGMGDVKLALLLGAMLGRSVGLALLLGFLFALVPSTYLLVRHGVKARKMALPLVPFLALGSLVTLFVGERALDWYAGTLG